ncbi:hypothetical protein BJ742DRAFT_328097 [Cladochytrium replicatum]|nr:hypothetical protein BJ742DRAFT_328097 [Cladochytrium replicatum]
MDIDVVTPRGPRTAASHLENNLGANDAAASSSHDPPPSVTSSPAASPSPSHDSTGTSNNTNAAGTPANSQPAPTPPTTATPGGAIPPRRRVRPIRWSRPLIMLGASSVFITAMLYAHTPSFPVPLVRSAVAIDFGEYKPFDGSSKMPGALTHITALASDGDVASGIGQDGVVRLGFLLRHLNQDKIESWIKARRRANVDSVNSTTEQNQTDSDMEVANFEIYQDFVVPLEAAYNTKIWPSTSNYVGPPLQRVKASPVFFDRIFGTVEFLAIEKHGVLEGGYPRLALMYSTVQDEDVQYRSRVYTLGSTTSSQTSAPNCSTSFIFRWPPNPESCIGMEDSLSRYAREDIKMPGTLAFDDFGLSWTGNVYYSRISDRRAFRWVGNSSSDLLVQGPTQGETLTTSNPYSQLVLYELYNPLTNQSSATMLKIRSRERDHILDFEVVISYRPPNSTTWKRDIMYKVGELVFE